MSKVHCFYHSADLDGHCSGAIVKHFVPEAILHPINYGDEFPWEEWNIAKGIAPDDTVYMVDFCLQPAADMQRLAQVCGSLIWIDHHQTALDSMKGWSIKGMQQVGFAGCELTWAYFRGDEDPPLAVELLGRYDVWDHSNPRTLPFQYRMRMEDLDPLKGEGAMEKWKTLFDPFDDGGIYTEGAEGQYLYLSDLVREGELLLRYADQENTKYARAYAFETEIVVVPWKHSTGVVTPLAIFHAICINRGLTNSKVFDSVYDPERHHLMITFCRLPLHKQTKGGWAVSLYSTRDDVDCGAIAKVFGGGGHKGAAGFQCDDLPFKI